MSKLPDKNDNRFSIRVLYGLFEADASGSVAVIVTVVALGMVLAGRWFGLV